MFTSRVVYSSNGPKLHTYNRGRTTQNQELGQACSSGRVRVLNKHDQRLLLTLTSDFKRGLLYRVPPLFFVKPTNQYHVSSPPGLLFSQGYVVPVPMLYVAVIVWSFFRYMTPPTQVPAAAAAVVPDPTHSVLSRCISRLRLLCYRGHLGILSPHRLSQHGINSIVMSDQCWRSYCTLSDGKRNNDNSIPGIEQAVNPFGTAVPLWGQTIWNSTGLSPKRDWGPERVNGIIKNVRWVIENIRNSPQTYVRKQKQKKRSEIALQIDWLLLNENGWKKSWKPR